MADGHAVQLTHRELVNNYNVHEGSIYLYQP